MKESSVLSKSHLYIVFTFGDGGRSGFLLHVKPRSLKPAYNQTSKKERNKDAVCNSPL